MYGQTVLVVEDDLELSTVISKSLREEGFEVQAVASGADLLDRLERVAPDVVVLDIGLPDADGRDLCQALRARGVEVPIVFLTARDAVQDRVAGFDAGGDDYLPKPFALAELTARLEALLRRSGRTGVLEAAGLQLDPATHSVGDGTTSVHLTPTEYRLLERLMARAGSQVAERDLVRAGWPWGAIVTDNTLHVYVARLRRKLRRLDDPPEIATIHRFGYKLA